MVNHERLDGEPLDEYVNRLVAEEMREAADEELRVAVRLVERAKAVDAAWAAVMEAQVEMPTKKQKKVLHRLRGEALNLGFHGVGVYYG